MRDRVERFVVLPFGIGCASETSVALRKSGDHGAKKPIDKTKLRRGEREVISSSLVVQKRNGFILSNISGGIQRLIRSIKSLSQMFVYKEESEEAEEKEMEIGFPTDVKHVTHIGLDGSRTTNPVKGWENLNPQQLLSFPSISIKQFELAMAAQSHNNVVKENHLKS